MTFSTFVPIIVMDTILLVITVLLAVASKLLVSYGTCRITIHKDDETESFDVEGGDNLLSYLIAHKLDISSSCGGKGTCGYCKIRVVSGGGEILPTEEVFMSRREKLNNMRLACQVKVKQDLEIQIPDYLEIVRELVVNKKFDPHKRWKVTIK